VLKHFYLDIDGYMTERNQLLFDFVIPVIPDNFIWVELGSWTGKSAAYCIVEMINQHKIGKFFCVDTWLGSIEHQNLDIVKNDKLFEVFKNNVSPILDKIEISKSISWKFANNFNNNSVDFCYVDAGHDYDSVMKDLAAWWPKIKPGSYFAGDDYTKGFPGVQKAVKDFFAPLNVKVRRKGRCWMVKK
jgi:hypothetical protein